MSIFRAKLSTLCQIVHIPRECVNTLLYIARARERERRAAELRAGEGTGQRDSIADGTALRGELHSLLVFFSKNLHISQIFRTFAPGFNHLTNYIKLVEHFEGVKK